MASFFYCQPITELMNAAGQDLDAVGTDMRAVLVMTNTTCDTNDNADTMAGFTVDEYDGAGYSAGGVTLGSKTLTETASAGSGTHNGNTTFDAADFTITGLGAGTRQCQAVVIIRWAGSLGASIPYAYLDGTGLPFTGDGGNRTFSFNASGIFRIKQV